VSRHAIPICICGLRGRPGGARTRDQQITKSYFAFKPDVDCLFLCHNSFRCTAARLGTRLFPSIPIHWRRIFGNSSGDDDTGPKLRQRIPRSAKVTGPAGFPVPWASQPLVSVRPQTPGEMRDVRRREGRSVSRIARGPRLVCEIRPRRTFAKRVLLESHYLQSHSECRFQFCIC
jgi:hypothetical protein